MEEDFIADSVADAGGSGITPSQQNNTDILNYHLLLPKTLLRLLRQIKTHLVLTRLCTLQRIKKLPLDASPDKDIMETNDTSPSFDTPTITIIRHDFQTAALLNASSEFIKKYPTNRAMIDAVNNLFLETFHSYTGRAHVSGSGDQKRLVIHFNFNFICITRSNSGLVKISVPFRSLISHSLLKRMTSLHSLKNMVTFNLAAYIPVPMLKSNKHALFL